jgi:hypothetical protein
MRSCSDPTVFCGIGDQRVEDGERGVFERRMKDELLKRATPQTFTD